MSDTGLSVVMCCHNSVPRLQATLRHLALQKNDSDQPRELILVDNGSSDGTGEFARRTWDSLGNPFPMVLLQESQLGLAFARKSGVLASKFDFGVFCDDDNWLANDYLDTAYDLLDKNPGTAAFGGDAVPVSDEPFPAWFYSHAPSFAAGSQANKEGDVTYRGYLWGAGLACRFDLLREIYQLGPTHQATGRRGADLMSGDDGEICLWFVSAGYRLGYSKELRLEHFISGTRLSNDYFESFILAPDGTGLADVAHFFSWRHRPTVRAPSQSSFSTLRVFAKSLRSFCWLALRPRVLLSGLRNEKLVRRATRKPSVRAS